MNWGGDGKRGKSEFGKRGDGRVCKSWYKFRRFNLGRPFNYIGFSFLVKIITFLAIQFNIHIVHCMINKTFYGN